MPEARVVGFAEVSLEVRPGPGQNTSWWLRGHGLLLGSSLDQEQELRKALWPRGLGPGENGEFLVQALVSPPADVASMAKPNDRRRVKYLDDHGRTRVRDELLSLEQHLTLARWLRPYTLNQRIIFSGLSQEEAFRSYGW